ncbi:SPOR domain-containing protein [Desulfovibrio sp. Huiquan2017]|uniref:SPOR domain-containing protein n=1 Tax=Desulfovibrio sp. Huiquan2017 TaxID=2816861 RepID=UPI001A92D477|nr:SPOR domain-containing protein [Desulfovibrio sp. Huiquan2017]
MKKTILALAVLTVALILSGCFRKHIESAPPVKQPAQTQTAPAERPIIEETHVVAEEKPLDGPVEEVYEVDAAKQAGKQAPAVGETELAEEPLPDADQLKREAEAAAAQGAPPATEAAERAEQAAQATPAPAATPVPAVATAPAAAAQTAKPLPPANPEDEVVGIGDVGEASGATAASTLAPGGPYYVQVGAFSDVENANRALERLIADGYKGSVLVKTDEGLFRVQAGSFPDEATAGAALEKLKADYPKGFVLKKP